MSYRAGAPFMGMRAKRMATDADTITEIFMIAATEAAQ